MGNDGMNNQAASADPRSGRLRAAAPWIAWGLSLQVLGAGGMAVVVWHGVRLQGITGHVTAEMIRLAWRSELHTRIGLVVLVAGSVVFAAGSVVMARPYVNSPITLFVAVPIAAVAGLFVLGVIVLLLAALAAALANAQGGIDVRGWFSLRRRRRP